jgi:hypothetical protein
MTNATLCINRLSYLGPNKPTVHVGLKPGLNIICGASETGKSFVVETIDFMLGGSSELRQLPERAGYDRAVIQITLSDDKKFTFQRSLDGGGFLWRVGHHDQLETTDEALKPTHNSDRDDNLSQRILSLLGWSDHRLRKDAQAATVSFTIRHLAYLSIVNETRIFDTASPVLSENKVSNTVEKSAFKFVLTGVDDSALVAVREARDSHARLVTHRNALAALIEERQAKLPPEEQIAQSRERLGRLQLRISSIGEDVVDDEQRHASASDRFRLLERFVQTSRRRKGEIDGLLQRFALLDQHYESDLSRLEAIAESGAVFKTLHPGPCPFCGAPPEAQVHERSCDVDPDQIAAAARAEIERIGVLRAGLVETKQRLSTEGQQISVRTDRAAEEQRQVFRQAQELAGILRERRRGIGDLDREAQQLRLQLKDTDVQEELKAELARMNEAVTTSEEQVTGTPRGALPPSETTEFAAEVEAILQAWDFPEAGRVAWEESRMDVTIGARRRGDQGKGLRAITCSAFLLGLLKRCLAKARPHLGLLVLDSPLLAYWKPEGQADDLRGTRVDECFYRWMDTLPPNNQVVVIENRPLPDWVSGVAHVIHFTKNRASDRYGLFEVERAS